MRACITAFLTSLVMVATFSFQAIAAGATAPVYPGAVAAAHPAGLGLKKAPPPTAKTYVTSDSFAKVKAWYQQHLKGAPEMAQPGMEKTEDAVLVGHGASGAVVVVQAYKGKTWITIGPPM